MVVMDLWLHFQISLLNPIWNGCQVGFHHILQKGHIIIDKKACIGVGKGWSQQLVATRLGSANNRRSWRLRGLFFCRLLRGIIRELLGLLGTEYRG
jgi:hypothetical protein